MRVIVKRANALSASEIARWTAIQTAMPELDSPYFSHGYAAAVADVDPRAEVAIVEDDGSIQAFFPFERGRFGTARSIGGTMCDFQGLVGQPDTHWSVEELLNKAGIGIWFFDHLIIEQNWLVEYHTTIYDSPYLDLSGGFDRYLEGVRSGEGKPFRRQFELMRKLEREIGPVRVEWDCNDYDSLACVLDWKSDQYISSGQTNLMRAGTTSRAIVERLFHKRSPECRGQLSLLYAGDTLLAGHFGIASSTVLHWWFPSYDRTYAKYSPGLLLLLCLAREAAIHGIKRIDLGRGGEEYKTRFRSGAQRIAAGAVRRPSSIYFVIDKSVALGGMVRNSRHMEAVKPVIKPFVRMYRYVANNR